MLAPDELIVLPPRGRAAYLKCTVRCADDWPALGIAVSVATEDEAVREARGWSTILLNCGIAQSGGAIASACRGPASGRAMP